jgi:hypothetical protein
LREQAAEPQKKEEWEKEDVPAAGDEHDSSKHECPDCEAHQALALLGVRLTAA